MDPSYIVLIMALERHLLHCLHSLLLNQTSQKLKSYTQEYLAKHMAIGFLRRTARVVVASVLGSLSDFQESHLAQQYWCLPNFHGGGCGLTIISAHYYFSKHIFPFCLE